MSSVLVSEIKSKGDVLDPIEGVQLPPLKSAEIQFPKKSKNLLEVANN
jgi:hypothetical protein